MTLAAIFVVLGFILGVLAGVAISQGNIDIGARLDYQQKYEYLLADCKSKGDEFKYAASLSCGEKVGHLMEELTTDFSKTVSEQYTCTLGLRRRIESHSKNNLKCLLTYKYLSCIILV